MKHGISTILGCLVCAVTLGTNDAGENAQKYYAEAFSRLPEYPESAGRHLTVIQAEGWVDEADALDTFLSEDRGIVKAGRQASRMQHCDFVPEVERTRGMRLPHVKQVRSLTTYLILKGRWHERKGDLNAAMECYALIRKLANHVAQGCSSLEKLNGRILRRQVNPSICDLVQQAPDTLLKTALDVCVETAPRNPLRGMIAAGAADLRTLTPERLGLGDADKMRERFGRMTQLRMGDEEEHALPLEAIAKRLEKILDEEAFFDPNVYATDLRKLGQNVHQEYMDAAQLPSYADFRKASDAIVTKHGIRRGSSVSQTISASRELCNDLAKAIRSAEGVDDMSTAQKLTLAEPALRSYVKKLRAGVLQMTVSGMVRWFDRFAEGHYGGLFDETALQLQITLEQYRRQTDSFPASLTELVPGYLQNIPIDPFDGGALHYRTTEEGYVLYSVGTDLADNGGDVGRYPRRLRLSRFHGSLGGKKGTDIVHFWPLEPAVLPPPQPPERKGGLGLFGDFGMELDAGKE